MEQMESGQRSITKSLTLRACYSIGVISHLERSSTLSTSLLKTDRRIHVKSGKKSKICDITT